MSWLASERKECGPVGRARNSVQIARNRDGRPQGPHPSPTAAPAPTIRRCRFRSYIVGAGEVWRRAGTLVVARPLSNMIV